MSAVASAATVTIPLAEYEALMGRKTVQGVTRIGMVLDRSGSMDSIIDDVIPGTNNWLAERQRESIPQTITVLLFDDRMEYPYVNAEPSQVKPFTRETYAPRGSTALYRAIDECVKRIERVMEPNDRALILIVTDGQENASNGMFTTFNTSRTFGEIPSIRYSKQQTKALIETKEGTGRWTFSYIGPGLDAYSEAASVGLNYGSTIGFNAENRDSVQAAFRALSASTTSYMASGASQSKGFYEGTIGHGGIVGEDGSTPGHDLNFPTIPPKVIKARRGRKAPATS